MKNWLIVSVLFLFVFSFSVRAWADGGDSQKLDRIIQNQNEILKELAEIKSQLEIVKVRASNK